MEAVDVPELVKRIERAIQVRPRVSRVVMRPDIFDGIRQWSEGLGRRWDQTVCGKPCIVMGIDDPFNIDMAAGELTGEDE